MEVSLVPDAEQVTYIAEIEITKFPPCIRAHTQLTAATRILLYLLIFPTSKYLGEALQERAQPTD